MIGGKLKQGETFEQAMIRELKEEANITAKEEDLEIINLANTIDARHFIQIGILVKSYTGEIKNMEPNKCEELKFFDKDNLPELFCGTEPNIKLFKEKKFYDKNVNY